MNDSVKDNATVDIKYIGRKSQDSIPNKEDFDGDFERTFANCTQEERLEIQKRYGTMIAYLESKERVLKMREICFLIMSAIYCQMDSRLRL